VKRRLAAILAADVVGYSRLMGEDEAGALARLKSLHKELVHPKITGGGGRIVKLMGDGLLAEFPSVVEAVQCAVDIQQDMVGREADLPDERRIRLRLGVNLGDIIVEGSDIYGDGVNVAARLEGLAEPGGICISGKVYEEVRNKLPTAFEDLGEQEVKNIPEPVRVYRWTDATADPVPGTAAAEGALPLPDKPSIAVLPFTNMSGDPEQDYFSDGITEDIITELSRFRSLFVIARNSSFHYKGQSPKVQDVGRELGVQYVVEGSVRKAGDRVRITAQVVEAASGNHLWAERYDRDLEDIFALQDEMTQTIVGAVEPELGAAERDRAARKPPESLDAWETYQRGLWYLWGFTKDGLAEAQRVLRRAQELDPGFATAYAFESYAHYLDVMLGFTEAPGESLEAASTAAKQALALDDKDPVAYFALGRVYMLRGKHDASIAELEMAIALSPSFAQAHLGLGAALILSGRLEEAAEALDKAIRLSPRDPVLWGTMGFRSLTCILLQQYEAAAEWARRAVHEPRAAGAGYWPYAMLASALGNLGQIAEAREAVEEAQRRKPDLSIAYLEALMSTKQPGSLDPYLDGLRKAGLSE
jgi:adenylate cyclase